MLSVRYVFRSTIHNPTGGIGENSPLVREAVCNDMTYLGIELDSNRNENAEGEMELSNISSKVKVFRIPTNEELVIALDTEKIVQIHETTSQEREEDIQFN